MGAALYKTDKEKYLDQAIGHYRKALELDEADAMTRTHPMGMVHDTALATAAGGTLEDPDVKLTGLGGTITQDLLDDQKKVQCTSCHEVHSSRVENQNANDHMKFASNNQLCATCHIK